jgi:hypothetical protein
VVAVVAHAGKPAGRLVAVGTPDRMGAGTLSTAMAFEWLSHEVSDPAVGRSGLATSTVWCVRRGTPGTRRAVAGAADSVAIMPTRCIAASGRHVLVLAAVLGLLLAATGYIVVR